MRDRRSTLTLLPFLFFACASSHAVAPRPAVDLSAARQAVETARAAGAEASASDAFQQALAHLREAEAEVALGDKGSSEKAAWLGRLAEEGAQCALAQSQVRAALPKAVPCATPSVSREPELRRKLEEAQAVQRRLEEEIATLRRERDILDKEILRTKTRLKGSATVEQVSSAIAEARVLTSRVPLERTSLRASCLEHIAKAEAQLRAENYPAALFFALEAQEEASQGPAPGPPKSLGDAKKSYTVTAVEAHVRKDPGMNAVVLGSLHAGDVVEGLAEQGEWVKVRSAETTGWVHRSLLD
jgi:hypothetical protein